jgi:adenylate kinase family enzyme
MNSKNLKILIVGVSASGKSTFARNLSDITKLPVIFMDSIMWNPGWEYIGDEETVEKLVEVSENPKWIIEGYITKGARTFLFEKADQIIYLDYSPLVCSLRYIKRWWKHRINPRPELEGSPEKFSLKFLRTIWNKWEAISLNKFLAQVPGQNKITIIKSPKAASLFISQYKFN